MSEDIQLIKLYKEGDEAAQKQLVEKYTGFIHSLIRKEIRNIRNGLDFNDLYQESLIAFDKAVRTFNPDMDMPLQAFAQVCIKRRLISYLRYQHKGYNIWNTISLDMVVNEDDQIVLADMIASPENKTVDLEDYIRVLDADEKKLVNMKLEGYRYSEIADAMSISVKEVDYYMRRILRKMKKVNEYYDQNEEISVYDRLQGEENSVYRLYKMGYKYREIARELKLSDSEVINAMQRIRRKIQKEEKKRSQ